MTIQEGCDKFCKFCVVPYTRGPEFSRDHNKILDEILSLTDNGTKEIVLLVKMLVHIKIMISLWQS